MPAPIDEGLCPVCGRPNGCMMAGPGGARSCAACWCARVTIDAAVRQRIPVAAAARACLCPACAAPPEAREERR